MLQCRSGPLQTGRAQASLESHRLCRVLEEVGFNSTSQLRICGATARWSLLSSLLSSTLAPTSQGCWTNNLKCNLKSTKEWNLKPLTRMHRHLQIACITAKRSCKSRPCKATLKCMTLVCRAREVWWNNGSQQLRITWQESSWAPMQKGQSCTCSCGKTWHKRSLVGKPLNKYLNTVTRWAWGTEEGTLLRLSWKVFQSILYLDRRLLILRSAALWSHLTSSA